ncbi:MAG: manganese efflux pump [Alicyclobacillaceae bacterium]|nr:manganese efflux pump [Alicyclobacillaceae bacterium]
MNWVEALVTVNLIGIGSNLDNCSVGIAYGSRSIRFPHRVNALINGIGCGAVWTGAVAGDCLSRYLLPSSANWIGCLVLCAVGLSFWLTAFRSSRRRACLRDAATVPHAVPQVESGMALAEVAGDAAEPSCDAPSRAGWREGVLLGLALSVTNVASGLGATVTGTASVWMTGISVTAWGYIMIWLGNALGIGVVARILGRWAPIVAGFLLMAVGVHQVL